MTHHRNHRRGRKEKKERVLHTRVPEALEAELKRLSEVLRLPVSNIVRAALEDVLEAARGAGRTAQGEVDDATDRFAWLQQRSRRYEEQDEYPLGGDRHGHDDIVEQTAPGPSSTQVERSLRGVIGFQQLKLARETKCTLCGRLMAPGQEAFVGVRDRRGPRVILGQECLPEAEEDSNNAATQEDNKESNHE